jgi:signal transduction histidine kinase
VTLRRRVLGYLAFAAIASCALTVGVAVVLVRHRIAAQRLSTLEAQANVVAATAGNAPGTRGELVYRVGGGRARPLAPALAAAVLAAIPGRSFAQGTATGGGRHFIYAVRPTAGGGRIVLVRGAGVAFGEWRPFLASLILAGLGGALLAVVLSFLLARRLTHPIQELAAATRRLSSGEAVTVPVTGDEELAGLGAAFNEMSTELARARESQRRFLESVSHELKTPLTSIRGYAEAIVEEAVDPVDGGRIISAEADRLERLVTDLLDLARLGRPGFSVARDTVELGAIATQAVERHLPRAHEMGVRLHSSTSGSPVVLGDEDRILQAASNLIENALRMTPRGGSVEVAAAPGCLSVTDNGPGLAEEDMPRAFERFYLHSRYRSERPVGSGLGLAIVKELMTAMGGSVEALSVSTGGAQFVLRFPASPSQYEAAPSQAAR